MLWTPTHVPQGGVVLLDTAVLLFHHSLSLCVHVQCLSVLYVCIVNYTMIRVTIMEEYMYSMYGMVVLCSRLHVQCVGKMAALEPVMCGVHLSCKSRGSDRDIVVACIQAVIPLWLLIVVGMFTAPPVVVLVEAEHFILCG